MTGRSAPRDRARPDPRGGRARLALLLPVLALLLGALGLLSAAPAQAQTAQTVPSTWSLKPSGITAGQSFRLLFLTSTKTAATSTSIATYNTFVQGRANTVDALKPFKGEFRAVASTASTDAKNNTATTWTESRKGVPIYWVGGAKVADHYKDFYDGSWDSYAARNEGSGNNNFSSVWTGSNNDGTKHAAGPAVGPLGGSFAVKGNPQSSGAMLDDGGAFTGTSFPLYGLSPVITVEAGDTTRPTVTAGSTGYFSDAGATTALTVAQKSGAEIYTKVTFSEDMKHTKSDGASARPVLFRRIGTTDTQYDILNNGDMLASGDCKPNHASNTNVYICRYTVGSSDNGAFTVKAGTNSVDKVGNALAAVYTHTATLTLDSTAPAAPRNLAATAGLAKVRLTWSAPSPADASIAKWQYRQKSTGAYGSWQDIVGGASAQAVDVTGLMSGTAYTFQVRAVDSATNAGAAGTAGPATPLAVGTGAPVEQTVAADWALIPKDAMNNALFTAGQRFRLLFVTSTRHPQTSTAISTYNGFVQSAANFNAQLSPFATQFRALISTATVDARDNTATTGTGVPIYWVQGAKVADNYADFYDGSWDSRAGKTEIGAASSAEFVLTGSNNNGTKSMRPAGHSVSTRIGSLRDGPPISAGLSILAVSPNRPLYALSPVLRVAGGATTTAPGKPSALALASGTASPGNDATPSVEVTVTETGGKVTLYSDSACTTAASAAVDVTDTSAPYKVTVDATALTADGAVTFHAKHANASDSASACSTASVAYTYDGTAPGIEFPPAGPRLETGSVITLTDATAKVRRHGLIEVPGTDTTAGGCDTASEVGSPNLTTLATPASPVQLSYTPPSDSVGKKVCVYAEDAAGNRHAAL